MADQTEYRYDVFISYNHADRTWVHSELLPWLKEAGLKVCIDECDFEVGTPSLVNMERAVDNSRHTLLVLTPAWIESEWTEFESLLAGTGDPAGRRRRLIPVMLELCKLPPRIAMLTCADLTQPSERAARMARLIKSLKPSETTSASSEGKAKWSIEGTESSTKHRRIDAAVPSHAEVGQSIDLLVQVRFSDSQLLGIKDWPTKHKPPSIDRASDQVALEFPIDRQTGKLGSARLEVRVVAPDFKIESQAQQLLDVPPDRYSKCVSFLLTAKRSGSCRINVEVYNVDRVRLGTIPVETTVGKTTAAPITIVTTLFLTMTIRSANDDLSSPVMTPEPLGLAKRDDREEPKLKSEGLSDKALRTLRDPVWQGIGVLVAIIVAFLTIPPLQHLFWRAAPVPTSSPTFTPPPASTWTPIPVVVITVVPTPTATARAPTATYPPSPTLVPPRPSPTSTRVPASGAFVTYGPLTYGPNKQTIANGTTLNADSLIYFSIRNVSGRRLLVEARGLRVDPLQNFINGGLIGRPESMTGAFYLEIDETVQIKVLLTDIRCSPCTIFPSALLPKKQDAVPGDPRDWLWVPGPSYRVAIQ